MRKHYQGLNAEIMTPLGKVTRANKIQVTTPDLWDVTNGVQILKQGDVSGSMEMKASALFGFGFLALAGGSWQRIKPLDFLSVLVSEDNGGLPITLVLENVLVHPPKDLSWDMVAGSDDIFTFEFKVMGNVLLNGVPVFDRKDEAGLL